MKIIQKFIQESVWYKKPMNQVVRDYKWQKLRKTLLGTWSEDSEKSCKVLKRYIGNMKDVRKVRQVMNYLTGTYFRTHKNPKCVIDIRNDLKRARIKYNQLYME